MIGSAVRSRDSDCQECGRDGVDQARRQQVERILCVQAAVPRLRQRPSTSAAALGESAKACEKKAYSETQRATHSSELEAVVSTSSVADEESAGVRRQLRTDAMCADVREIFATTKKDLEPGIVGVQAQDLGLDDNSIVENTQSNFPLHVNLDVSVAMQQQVPVTQQVQTTIETSQLQFSDGFVDVPVCKSETSSPQSSAVTNL